MVFPPHQAERFNELCRHRDALDLIMGMATVICNKRLWEDLRRERRNVQDGINRLVESEVVLK